MTKQPVFKARYRAIKNHKCAMQKDLSLKLSQSVFFTGFSGTVLCNSKVFKLNFTCILTIVVDTPS